MFDQRSVFQFGRVGRSVSSSGGRVRQQYAELFTLMETDQREAADASEYSDRTQGCHVQGYEGGKEKEQGCRLFLEVIGMSKILIVIGLILTLVVTLPILILLILTEAALIYRDRRERPDANPPSKDEWRLM